MHPESKSRLFRCVRYPSRHTFSLFLRTQFTPRFIDCLHSFGTFLELFGVASSLLSYISFYSALACGVSCIIMGRRLIPNGPADVSIQRRAIQTNIPYHWVLNLVSRYAFVECSRVHAGQRLWFNFNFCASNEILRSLYINTAYGRNVTLRLRSRNSCDLRA